MARLTAKETSVREEATAFGKETRGNGLCELYWEAGLARFREEKRGSRPHPTYKGAGAP